MLRGLEALPWPVDNQTDLEVGPHMTWDLSRRFWGGATLSAGRPCIQGCMASY